MLTRIIWKQSHASMKKNQLIVFTRTETKVQVKGLWERLTHFQEELYRSRQQSNLLSSLGLMNYEDIGLQIKQQQKSNFTSITMLKWLNAQKSEWKILWDPHLKRGGSLYSHIHRSDAFHQEEFGIIQLGKPELSVEDLEGKVLRRLLMMEISRQDFRWICGFSKKS